MKLPLLLLFFSATVFAQDICGPRVKPADCQKAIKDAIFDQNNSAIKKVIAAHGLKIIFEVQDLRGPFGHIRMASFFKFTSFFKVIAAHPDYPNDIPDKGSFLNTIFDDAAFAQKDPELVKLLFKNADEKKNLTWWENRSWPYPMLDKFKADTLKRQDKAKYLDLLNDFDDIDSIKKDICQIKSVTQIEQVMKTHPGIEVLFKKDDFNLLACSIDAKNSELAMYLLHKNWFPPDSLAPIVAKVEQGAPTDGTLELFSLLQNRMAELHLTSPNRRTNQNLWVLGHLNEDIKCLIEGSPAKPSEATESFSKLIEKIVYSAFLEQVEELRLATLKADRTGIKEKIKNIIELISESGFPLNFQDSNGKTIMHHLAVFADKTIIDAIETGLNTSRNMMDYNLQDNEGNTPLQIALLNKNLKGAMILSDGGVLFKDGFSMGPRDYLQSKNKNNQKPLDILNEIEIERRDKENKQLKKYLKLIYQGRPLPVATGD